MIPSGNRIVISPLNSESVSSWISKSLGSTLNTNGSPFSSKVNPEPPICTNCEPIFVNALLKAFATETIGVWSAVTTPTVGSPSVIPPQPLVTPAFRVNSGMRTFNVIGVSSPIETPIPPRFSREVMIWIPDKSSSADSSSSLNLSARLCNSLVTSSPISLTNFSNPEVVISIDTSSSPPASTSSVRGSSRRSAISNPSLIKSEGITSREIVVFSDFISSRTSSGILIR